MQDRYAGDTPDFGKYYLLTRLQESSRLRLGVNWYRVRPDEVDARGNNDGETRHHISSDKYKSVDPILYEKLLPFRCMAHRNLENLQDAGVFPRDTVFYNEILSFVDAKSKCEKLEKRRAWFDRSLSAL